jgi:hypothetical protein
MAEWLNAHPWKGCMRVSASGVRIPLSPRVNEMNERREKKCPAALLWGFESRSHVACDKRDGVEKIFYTKIIRDRISLPPPFRASTRHLVSC